MQFGARRAAGGMTSIVAALVASVATVVMHSGPPVAALEAASQSCDPTPSDVEPHSPPLASFESVAPVRLVDTRDGTGGVESPLGAGCTLRLDLGVAGVPAEVAAVALSTTVIAELAGFVTVFPCAAGRPRGRSADHPSGRRSVVPHRQGTALDVPGRIVACDRRR